jgi:CheY-like chemotaxis protein
MLGLVRVLLIEDNPADVEIFVQLLGRSQYRISPESSYTVVVAPTMDEASRLIEEGATDIIVADLLLPGMSPNEILALIERVSSKLPVVALTTDDRMDIAIDAIRHGAQDYLVKNRATGDVIERAIRYAVERKVLSEEQVRIRDDL